MTNKVVRFTARRINFCQRASSSSFMKSSKINSIWHQSHPLFFALSINSKGANRFNIIQRIYVGELGSFYQRIEESRSICSINSFTEQPILPTYRERLGFSFYVVGRWGCFQNI